MNPMETSDWLVLNNIIYKIYTTGNLDQMRMNLLEQLKLMVDFDSADFFLARKDGTQGLEKPIFYNCDGDTASQYDLLDYSRGIMYSGKSMVYRETDIISDDKRKQTEYYRKVYYPNNWHYALQMIIAKEKVFLGVITLYRTIGKDDFSYADVFLLDMLKEHLAFCLYQNRENEKPVMNKLSILEAVEQYSLTKREEMVLRLLMKGVESESIGEELTISLNTVKKHILNIYRKLGINNRVQLFKLVREKE